MKKKKKKKGKNLEIRDDAGYIILFINFVLVKLYENC